MVLFVSLKVYIIRAHNVVPTEETTEVNIDRTTADDDETTTRSRDSAAGKKKKGTSKAATATPISSVGSRRSTRLKAKE